MKYSAIVDKHIKPAIGGYLIQAIDSLMIEQFSHDLLTEKALTPKTVRDILSLLKTVLQYAHKTASGIDLVEVTYPKLPKQEMRILVERSRISLFNIFSMIPTHVSSEFSFRC